jgi:predicted DNA-binding transcriptional regulator YafY
MLDFPMAATTSGARGLSRDEVKAAILRYLREAGEHGLTKDELVKKIGNTSPQTVQRALAELRDEGAPIHCEGRKRWCMTAPHGMPLVAPEHDDLLAVLVAQAILEPLADTELRGRLQRLVAALDDRLRQSASPSTLPRSSMTATLTLATPIDAGMLRTLMSACGRTVLKIRYVSPWKPVAQAERRYTIEPWAVRVHDGSAYVRAWARESHGPRTFRVAQIEEVASVQGEPTKRRPPSAMIWGDEDPRFGIDHDRPGYAVIRLRGPVARWVARGHWHPEERDRWLVPGELLERKLSYRSCRELARRIASVIDGVDSIEPRELRMEVIKMVRKWRSSPRLPGVLLRLKAGNLGRQGADRARQIGGK